MIQFKEVLEKEYDNNLPFSRAYDELRKQMEKTPIGDVCDLDDVFDAYADKESGQDFCLSTVTTKKTGQKFVRVCFRVNNESEWLVQTAYEVKSIGGEFIGLSIVNEMARLQHLGYKFVCPPSNMKTVSDFYMTCEFDEN